MTTLTEDVVAKLSVEDGAQDRLVFDSVCRGFAVRVTKKSRIFLVQWTDPTDPKKRIREKLGVWGSLTVSKAREAARIKLGEVAKGNNPRAERLQKAREAETARKDLALTLRVLVEKWATLHLEDRSTRYKVEATRAIFRAFEDYLDRPASQLTRADVVEVLDHIHLSGKKAMAVRIASYARAAFQWATKRGQIETNPFLNLPASASIKARDRALTDDELRTVWLATRALPYPWGPFYRLALLTLQRREEVAGMRWSELDLARRVWTIPANRMKNGKPHDIHISAAALEELQAIPKDRGDLVFSRTGVTPISGFSKAKRALDVAISRRRDKDGGQMVAEWRLHDLRRTGVSALARLGIDSIVADRLLAHQPSKLSGVAAVYQRHDFAAERTKALDAWATHVTANAG